MVCLKNLREDVANRNNIRVEVENEKGEKKEFETKHSLSDRQIQILLKGGIINEFKERLKNREVNAVNKNTVTGNPRDQIK